MGTFLQRVDGGFQQVGAPVKSSGSDGGHVQRQQVNDQPLPWEEGQSTPASGQCEVDPNPIKSQGDSGVTTEEGTHPFQLARQKIKEAPIVQKAARFAEKANVRLKQSTSMVEASKILLEPYEKYVLGNKAIAKTKLGEMIQIEAEAYKVALSRAVAKPTKENLKNLATIAQSFSKNLAFVGQYTALHENYSKLPKTLRDTPAMIEIHGDLLSLQNALHTGKIDIEGGVALAEKFTVTMVGLWSSVINKGDQNLAGILETLKSPKHGFDPQTAVELDQIEQSLSENSDAPLDMGLMVKHSGALMAAMGIAQTFDPGRLDAIRKVPDPLLRSAIGMSQIENILQSKDTPAMFKENPEVLLAFFVDQGIVTADGIGAERLTQLVGRSAEVGRAMREKKIGLEKGQKYISAAFAGMAWLIGQDQGKSIIEGIESKLTMDEAEFHSHYLRQQRLDALVGGTYYDELSSTYDCEGIDSDCDPAATDTVVEEDKLYLRLKETRRRVKKHAESEYDTKVARNHALRNLYPTKEVYVRGKLVEYFSKHLDKYPSRVTREEFVGLSDDGIAIEEREYDFDRRLMSDVGTAWKEYQATETPQIKVALRDTLADARPNIRKGIHGLVEVDSFGDLVQANASLAKTLSEKENSMAVISESVNYLRAVADFKKLSHRLNTEQFGPAKRYGQASMNAKRILEDTALTAGVTLEEIRGKRDQLARGISSLHDQMAVADISNAVGMAYLSIALIAVAAQAAPVIVEAVGLKGVGAFLVEATTFSLVHQLGSAAVMGEVPATASDVFERWMIDVATFGSLRGAKIVGRLTGYNPAAGKVLLENGASALKGSLSTKQYRSLASLYGASHSMASGMVDDALKLIASYNLLHGSQMGMATAGVGEMPQEFWNAESAATLTIIHMLGKGRVPGGKHRARSVRVKDAKALAASRSLSESRGFRTETTPKGFNVLDPVQNVVLARHSIESKAMQKTKAVVGKGVQWAQSNPEKVMAASALLAAGLMGPETVSEFIGQKGANLLGSGAVFLGGFMESLRSVGAKPFKTTYSIEDHGPNSPIRSVAEAKAHIARLKTACENGGQGKRIPTYIEGRLGRPVDPALAEYLRKNLHTANGKHPVQLDLLLVGEHSSGAKEVLDYSYYHRNGRKIHLRSDQVIERGESKALLKVGGEDFRGTDLKELVKLEIASGHSEVRIQISKSASAEDAVAFMRACEADPKLKGRVRVSGRLRVNSPKPHEVIEKIPESVFEGLIVSDSSGLKRPLVIARMGGEGAAKVASDLQVELSRRSSIDGGRKLDVRIEGDRASSVTDDVARTLNQNHGVVSSVKELVGGGAHKVSVSYVHNPSLGFQVVNSSSKTPTALSGRLLAGGVVERMRLNGSSDQSKVMSRLVDDVIDYAGKKEYRIHKDEYRRRQDKGLDVPGEILFEDGGWYTIREFSDHVRDGGGRWYDVWNASFGKMHEYVSKGKKHSTRVSTVLDIIGQHSATDVARKSNGIELMKIFRVADPQNYTNAMKEIKGLYDAGGKDILITGAGVERISKKYTTNINRPVEAEIDVILDYVSEMRNGEELYMIPTATNGRGKTPEFVIISPSEVMYVEVKLAYTRSYVFKQYDNAMNQLTGTISAEVTNHVAQRVRALSGSGNTTVSKRVVVKVDLEYPTRLMRGPDNRALRDNSGDPLREKIPAREVDEAVEIKQELDARYRSDKSLGNIKVEIVYKNGDSIEIEESGGKFIVH